MNAEQKPNNKPEISKAKRAWCLGTAAVFATIAVGLGMTGIVEGAKNCFKIHTHEKYKATPTQQTDKKVPPESLKFY